VARFDRVIRDLHALTSVISAFGWGHGRSPVLNRRERDWSVSHRRLDRAAASDDQSFALDFNFASQKSH
jgi:hypothetical protein